MARPRRRTGAAGDELEAAFAIKVENLLTLYGWRWYHTHDSRRSAPGFPDYVALRGPELLVVELKTATGRLRPAQAEWLEAWRTFARAIAVAVGALGDVYAGSLKAEPVVEVHLWRPADLEAINERLSHGRHRLDFVG